MGRIIAVNSNCYHGYSIEQAIDGIAAAGFRYIELTATKGWTEHVFPDQSFERLWQVKERLAEKGLTPFSMSGHCNLMDTARIHDFISNIRLAAFFGCGYIVSSIGEAHLSDQAVASNEVVAEHIRALVPELEKYGLTLVLETHGDHGSGRILKEIVESGGLSQSGHQLRHRQRPLLRQRGLGGGIWTPAWTPSATCTSRTRAASGRYGTSPPWARAGWTSPWSSTSWQRRATTAPSALKLSLPRPERRMAEINQAVKDSAEYLTAHGFVL